MSFQLNQAQAKAVEHEEGSAIIIAGAGTGKTRVITQRIIRLLEKTKCKPENILALTFTEKAAYEMQERIDLMMPLGFGEVKIRTFHAFAKEVLAESGLEMGLDPDFTLLDETSAWIFLRQNLSKLKLDYFRPLGNPTKFVAELNRHFSRLKEEDISPQIYQTYAENLNVSEIYRDKLQEWEEIQAQKKHKTKKEPPLDDFQKEAELFVKKERELAQAYSVYEKLLTEKSKMDFGGLIYLVLQLFRERSNVLGEYQKRYQYILVDEFQDTNFAQNELVEMLAQKHDNLMVVGDDDQSIYKFRGASLSNILQFEERHPDCQSFVLTENYRSSSNILDLAYSSIKNNNPNRLEVKLQINKQLQAKGGRDLEQIKLWEFQDDLSEAEQITAEILRLKTNALIEEQIPFNEIAVLVRNRSSADIFLGEFDRKGIPYRFVGNRGLFLRPEIKELISFLTVLSHPDDNISLFGLMQSVFFDFNQIDLIRYLQESRKNNSSLFSYLEKLTKNQQTQNVENLEIFDDLEDHEFEEKDISPQSLQRKELNAFLDLLKRYFEKSQKMSVGQLLWDFLKEIKLEEILSQVAQEEGIEECQIRSGNLHEFFQKIQNFEKESEDKTVLAFIDYLLMQIEAGDNPKTAEASQEEDAVKIMTIHMAKGLEFEAVFLPALVQNKFPASNRGETIVVPEELIQETALSDDFHTEEERRLFYVALTRAKQKLYLSYAKTYNSGTRDWKRSNFLTEIIDSPVLDFQEFKQKSEILEELESKYTVKKFSVEKTSSAQNLFNHQFSYTQINTYENCPKKYHYHYLLKIPSEPAIATNFGSSVHNALKDFYREMRKKHQIPSFESLKLYLKKNWLSSGYHDQFEEADYLSKAEEMLKHFYQTNEQNGVIPEFIEAPFRLKLFSQKGDFILINGRIDRIDRLSDESYEVIDYKTGQMNSSMEKKLSKDLQLSLYAIATREILKIDSTKFSLYFLKDNQKISTERSESSLLEAKAKIWEIVGKIKDGNFKATPDKTICKFCDYRKICPEALV